MPASFVIKKMRKGENVNCVLINFAKRKRKSAKSAKRKEGR